MVFSFIIILFPLSHFRILVLVLVLVLSQILEFLSVLEFYDGL